MIRDNRLAAMDNHQRLNKVEPMVRKNKKDIQTNVQAIEEIKQTYAKKDASNLDDVAIAAWQTKLGNGVIEASNKGLVTGETIYNEVHVDNGLHIKANNTVANNLKALDEAMKSIDGATIKPGTISEDKLNPDLVTKFTDKSKETVVGTNGIEVTGDGQTDNQAFTVKLSDDVMNKINTIENKLNKNGDNIGGEAEKKAFGNNVGVGTVSAGDTSLVQADAVQKHVASEIKNVTDKLLELPISYQANSDGNKQIVTLLIEKAISSFKWVINSIKKMI